MISPRDFSPFGAWKTSFRRAFFGAVLLALHGQLLAQQNVQRTEEGLLIKLADAQIELAAVTPETLLLSVARDAAPTKVDSTFLSASTTHATISWQHLEEEGLVGVGNSAGQLLINPKNGEWTLRDAAGKTLIPLHPWNPKLSDDQKGAIDISVGDSETTQIYGGGNGTPDLLRTKIDSHLGNGVAVVPYYWSTAGYAALGVTKDDNHPAIWQGSTKDKPAVWSFPGSQADLYLMPAESLKTASAAYFHLTGAATVPPLWAFGYQQSRWGWGDRAYIEETLKKFHDLKMPVDAFIYDFEWYTPVPDYDVKPQGISKFDDFGWNEKVFPEAVEQIKAYKEQGVRFIGIRKPRLINSEDLIMMRENKWASIGKTGDLFQKRDINFANSDVRAWYAGKTLALLKAGADDGWWNDEGEGYYTLYYYWNLAETQSLAKCDPNKRFWSLNRAYSPGLPRLGAAAWTGDVSSEWKTLQETPASLLSWSISGMPYSACDIGGFHGEVTPDMLARWMEAGVFFPYMRAHSTVMEKPHFPWLFGPDAQAAIQKALELRYRLIPYFYSLAHETWADGQPLMRPMIMEFPADDRFRNTTDQWMMGSSLLAAPILNAEGKRSIVLPEGDWFSFNSSQRVTGGKSVDVVSKLDEIPVYIKAGSILPLAPVLQNTGQLPGGPLEVQIYPGKDATFSFVEDDGGTTDYQKGQVRRTTFKWNDAARQLTWEQSGPYAGKNVFRDLKVVLFLPDGAVKSPQPFTPSGKIQM